MTDIQCRVRGCEAGPDAEFHLTRPGALRRVALVCDFHHRQLSLGAPWSMERGSNDLIVSDATAPLDVVGFRATHSLGTPLVTLQLGHDEVADQEILLRFDPKMLRSICNVVNRGGHPQDQAPD